MPENRLSEDLGKLILRLTVGSLMLLHGVNTLLHADTLAQLGGVFASLNLPATLAYGLYLGELVAPLMIIFGLCTRLGGLILALYIGFSLWLLPYTGGVSVLLETSHLNLELQVLYLFGAFTIALLGSGRIAIRPNRLKGARSLYSAHAISTFG